MSRAPMRRRRVVVATVAAVLAAIAAAPATAAPPAHASAPADSPSWESRGANSISILKGLTTIEVL